VWREEAISRVSTATIGIFGAAKKKTGVDVVLR
jgi:hypothetical protein